MPRKGLGKLGRSTEGDRQLASWRDEIDSAALYRALADLEPDPRLAGLSGRLPATEEHHAGFWEERLRAGGRACPGAARGLACASAYRARAAVRHADGAADAQRSRARRRQRLRRQSRSRAASMPDEERSHARLLESLSSGGGVGGAALGRFEGRHRAASGNALRAAVLGANDGLLSNFSLVMGVAGAQVSANTVLVTGLAGLLAGAGSMAMGEWVSVTSARELAGHQLEIEARHVDQIPDRGARGARADLRGQGPWAPSRPASSRRARSPTARRRSTRWRAKSSASIPRISAVRPPWPRRRRSCCSRSARVCP